MSGHSKWANIRVKKTAQDAKRGKIFTRHARLIEMAARHGADPVMNPSLRTAIDNAKADSVPNANIDRAIKKGSGELKGEQMQEMIFEAYGPGGTGYIIECLSDNRNRTTASVRTIVGKAGGRMAEGGAVAYLFDRKGVVIGSMSHELRMTDELELALIDAGAEDIRQHDDAIEVITSVADWSKVRKICTDNGMSIVSAGLSYIPKQAVPVRGETAEKVQSFIEKIEEDDDVSEVHTNAEMM
jgi:YebC/PmpR family DNA-binding regulatory protein